MLELKREETFEEIRKNVKDLESINRALMKKAIDFDQDTKKIERDYRKNRKIIEELRFNLISMTKEIL